MRRKLLNVGGNSKAIELPPQYEQFEHLMLDIDPAGHPDILCDARQMDQLPAGTFDVVYCSHNLEHYYRHEIRKVLSGFTHVLKEDGFAHVIVPDIGQVMKAVVDRELDIDDELHQSDAGPITVHDVIYGLAREIEQSGHDYFAHKSGFTEKSLKSTLLANGFSHVYTAPAPLVVHALAFKTPPGAFARSLFNLPPAE